MKCYILSSDLMFSSQASSMAKQCDLDSQTIGNFQSVAADEPSIVVLDLSAPGLDIANAIKALREQDVHVIAIGPHVHADKLAAAQAAGATVMSKGQAQRDLGGALREIKDSQ